MNANKSPIVAMTGRTAPIGSMLAATIRRVQASAQEPEAPAPGEAVPPQPAPPAPTTPGQPPPAAAPQQPPPEAQSDEEQRAAEETPDAEGQAEEETKAEEEQPVPAAEPEQQPAAAARSFSTIDSAAVYRRLNSTAQTQQGGAASAPVPPAKAFGPSSARTAPLTTNEIYRRMNGAPRIFDRTRS